MNFIRVYIVNILRIILSSDSCFKTGKLIWLFHYGTEISALADSCEFPVWNTGSVYNYRRNGTHSVFTFPSCLTF